MTSLPWFRRFWLILPAEFPAHRAIGRVVRVAGRDPVLGFLSHSLWRNERASCTRWPCSPPPSRASSGDGGCDRHRSLRRHKLLLISAFGSIAAATIDSLLYAAARDERLPSCPPALPIFQRLTMLFVLGGARRRRCSRLAARERQI